MKNLSQFVIESSNNFTTSPNFPGVDGKKAYDYFLQVAKEGLDFDYDKAYFSADYREGFSEYSSKASKSLDTAWKKYYKFLEKNLKDKFTGKSDKTIEELSKEFIKLDYLKDEAWEWAPGAGTDLFEMRVWPSFDNWLENLKFYFSEIDRTDEPIYNIA